MAHQYKCENCYELAIKNHHDCRGPKKEITDTERLEWLVKNDVPVRQHESGYYIPDEPGSISVFKTFREAIDAAMKEKK